ncbi:type IV pilin protein [Amantichitinum ursilacus]|uniref:Putative major pilin subunit n=1 Tax=Amantichitinum ursilacus TaxID=857265 RepID=A0A0N0GMX6_9NEIS|nr:type IV pilin protein [Amantichitinum ursilacus]KPC52149.1 putative major pilin subunit [Amantichitinum ursilacus]
MRSNQGFTLMELMIILAIVAILTGVAIPLYQTTVMKSRRTTAQTALLDVASREERFFAANNSYTSDLSALGYGVSSSSTSMPIPDSTNHFYDVPSPTVTTGASAGYTLQATPATSQLKDTTCYTYTYNSFGVRGNVNGSATLATCWN